MIRLLLRLFNIKDFESCKSCETLKQQLEYERDENRRLTNTILEIVKPKVIVPETVQEINPVIKTTGLWARRRAELERKDAEDARLKKASTILGRPDNIIAASVTSGNPGPIVVQTVEQLEQELGIEENQSNG